METLLFWNWHAVPLFFFSLLLIGAAFIFMISLLSDFNAHSVEKSNREREVRKANSELNRAIARTNDKREDLQAELTERDIDLPEEDATLIEMAKQIITDEQYAYPVKGCLERFETALKDEQTKRDLQGLATETLDDLPGPWRHTGRELRRAFSWLNVFLLFIVLLWGYYITLSVEMMMIKDDTVTAGLAEQFDEVRAYNAYTNNATVMVDDCPVVLQARYDYDLREVIVSDDGRIANRDYIVLEGDSYVTPCIDK